MKLSDFSEIRIRFAMKAKTNLQKMMASCDIEF